MKRNSLLLALGIILIPAILGLIFLSTNKKSTTPTTGSSKATITRVKPTGIPTPLPTRKQEVLLERFENRKQLSEQDKQAKKNIQSHLPPGKSSGVVYSSANVKIEYTNSADLIQVEVRTREIQKAKEEAVAWLKSQSMTQEGICYAPVQFYPSFDLNQELKQQGIEFNPLAPGC